MKPFLRALLFLLVIGGVVVGVIAFIASEDVTATAPPPHEHDGSQQ